MFSPTIEHAKRSSVFLSLLLLVCGCGTMEDQNRQFAALSGLAALGAKTPQQAAFYSWQQQQASAEADRMREERLLKEQAERQESIARAAAPTVVVTAPSSPPSQVTDDRYAEAINPKTPPNFYFLNSNDASPWSPEVREKKDGCVEGTSAKLGGVMFVACAQYDNDELQAIKSKFSKREKVFFLGKFEARLPTLKFFLFRGGEGKIVRARAYHTRRGLETFYPGELETGFYRAAWFCGDAFIAGIDIQIVDE